MWAVWRIRSSQACECIRLGEVGRANRAGVRPPPTSPTPGSTVVRREAGSTRRPGWAAMSRGWSGAAKCEHSYRTRIARRNQTTRVRWRFRRSARQDVPRALSLVNRWLGVRVPPPAPIPLSSNEIQRSSLKVCTCLIEQVHLASRRRAHLRKRRAPASVRTSRMSASVRAVQGAIARGSHASLELWPVHPRH